MDGGSVVFQEQLWNRNFQEILHFRNFLMESLCKTKSTDSSFWNLVSRTKSYSSTQTSKMNKCQEFTSLREFDVELSPTFQKKLTVESLSAYAIQLVSQVYDVDPLGIGKIIGEFLTHDLSKFRHRITERVALLKYLVDSLKYKPYTEVQRQILKQWKKNVIFFSINTIWATKMATHKFKALHQFTEEYKKQIALVANLTHFYFKDALSILDGKNNATFCHIQQDTAHKILNSLRDWGNLYKETLIPLIKRKNFNRKHFMNMNYDPKALQINEQYLDLESGRAQLIQTTQKIKKLAYEPVLHNKIQILKEIRATFIRQIEESRKEISKGRNHSRYSPLQKDDIIGCIIYCIISGQINEIQACLQSITQLLGPNNELLSRRGVDSYRADLQSSVEYLCQQSEQNLLKSHILLEDEEIKIQIVNKSTCLELSTAK